MFEMPPSTEKSAGSDAGVISSDLVLYAVNNGVALITLNNPLRNNAWSAELGDCFFDRLDQAALDPDVRSIVVTGAGKTFCPGADMEGMSSNAHAGNGIDATGVRRYLTHPLTIPKPIIGAINGACAGFGFVLTAMFDIRFAARGAKFTTSFARRGVAAEWAITLLLPQLVGLQRALDLLLSGRVFTADEALTYGYLLGVAEPTDVVDVALKYAGELATFSSPTAMAAIRRQVYDDLGNSLKTARESSMAYMRLISQYPDFVEGVDHYAEGRPPRFPPLAPDFKTAEY
jgi:enoyl-CoA hydratase/carnithine racemase